jgi:hypothetical protein
MHIEAHQRIGLDSVVTSSGGPAAVPVARLRPGAGHVQEWAPPLAEGIESTALGLAEGSELLLSAEIEPERVPPRTKLTYANRQDLLRSREVLVWIRSNESATAIASGQLEWPNGSGRRAGRVVYGLTGVKRKLEAGRKAPLRLKLPRLTYEAALGALADGQRILVKVTVGATDAAGNRSGTTVATIRPRR